MKKGTGRGMKRELVAAMHEYLQAADSVERGDLSTNETRPVLDALRVAHRNLLDQLKAFEASEDSRGFAVIPAVRVGRVVHPPAEARGAGPATRPDAQLVRRSAPPQDSLNTQTERPPPVSALAHEKRPS